MSRFNRESLRLVLCREAIELWAFDARAKDWIVRGRIPAALVDRATGFPRAAEGHLEEALEGLFRAHAASGSALSTLIDDDCVLYFVVDPPGNARTVGDLRLAARLRLESLYGGTLAEWTVVADWRATRRFLACAVPTSLLAAVARVLPAFKLRDTGTSTELVSCWNLNRSRMSNQQGWVVHVGRRVVAIAACVGGAPAAVAMSSLALPLAVDRMMTEIGRCALRWNLAVPDAVYLLGEGAASIVDQNVDGTAIVRIPAAAKASRLGVSA